MRQSRGAVACRWRAAALPWACVLPEIHTALLTVVTQPCSRRFSWLGLTGASGKPLAASSAWWADAPPAAGEQGAAEQVGPDLDAVEPRLAARRPQAHRRGRLREQRQLDRWRPLPADGSAFGHRFGATVSKASRAQASANHALSEEFCAGKPPGDHQAPHRYLHPCRSHASVSPLALTPHPLPTAAHLLRYNG